MDGAVGERAQAIVQRTERNCPSKVTLLPSVVNGWQTGPFCPPSYVRRSEDRLSEPRSPRLDHRRNHPVRGVLATFAYWVSRAYDSSAMVKVRHRRVRFQPCPYLPSTARHGHTPCIQCASSRIKSPGTGKTTRRNVHTQGGCGPHPCSYYGRKPGTILCCECGTGAVRRQR